MPVSADRLSEVDEQLAGLGRTDDQVHGVLARFEDRDPEDLSAVDEELERLEADVQGTAQILERARAEVSSALGEAEAPARPAAEPAAARAVSPSSAGALDAASLFGDDELGEAPPGSPVGDLSDLFADAADDGGFDSDETDLGLADSLEAAVGEPAEEEPGDSTGVFSADDIAAIEGGPPEPAAARPRSVPPPLPTEPPAPRPSQHPRDPDLDALLGDDEQAFRPSQFPASGAITEGATSGEFELLVDEDILLVDDEDADDFPEELPTEIAESPLAAEAARSASASEAAEPAETSEEAEPDAEKKGFFKKLFGGD